MKECSLVDGYAVIIQFLVGIIAISTLLVKRNMEWPKRPLLIWFFDASKQGFASFSMHITNVIAATLSTRTISGNMSLTKDKDPCIWYFACLLVDATLLLLVMSLLLMGLSWFVDRMEIEELRHGEYGDPPRRRIWALQLVVYALLLFSAKGFCLWILYRNSAIISSVAGFLLKPFMFHHRFELIFVMMIFPFFSSIMTYWIIDQMIKANWYDVWNRRAQAGWEYIAPESHGSESSDESNVGTPIENSTK